MELFATALLTLADAWALILQPVVLGYLVLGVVMGLAVGVFPGLGGISQTCRCCCRSCSAWSRFTGWH